MRAREQGLTLLELLIVLLLMSLMAGLVAPRVLAQLAGAEQRAAFRQARDVVDRLPLQAFARGEALEISTDQLMASEGWPAGWRVSLTAPLRYSPNGIASGGELLLRGPSGAEHAARIEPFSGHFSSLP
jgi:prepilin-type N-terminal cleavage/methylation domain-containing protein